MTPWFKVVNNGPDPLNLSQVKIRYWYTKDTCNSQVLACDWAQVGAGNITGTFGQLSSPTNNNDCYFEAGFTEAAGNLAPGQDSGEIQLRLYNIDWSSCVQENDYSFNFG
jgi:hypothetical protein